MLRKIVGMQIVYRIVEIENLLFSRQLEQRFVSGGRAPANTQDIDHSLGRVRIRTILQRVDSSGEVGALPANSLLEPLVLHVHENNLVKLGKHFESALVKG